MREVFASERIRVAEQAYARELDDGTLMQRAAHGLANRVIRMMGDRLGGIVGRRVVILVGSGSNGGDALFAGARLADRGAQVSAVIVADRHHVQGATTLLTSGGCLVPLHQAGPALAGAHVVIDGILGIGARGAPREPVIWLLQEANEVPGLKVAVDVPTGVQADTGEVPGSAFRADLTVTFAAAKPGLMIAPGKEFAGQVEVIDIGIGDALTEPAAGVYGRAEAACWLPVPGFDDHKYRRGLAGLAAGSRAYPGAALLCAGAALTGPTGMTAVLDRGDGVADLVISHHPEVVRLDQISSRVTGWACGPGFTTTDADRDAVEAVCRTSAPVVLDAGALTLLGASQGLRDLVRTRAGATILTPHEGEFARLGGDLGPGRLAAAKDLAYRLDAVIVLKGPGSVIASPDGTCFIDEAGTSDLATAGSGDVLAGFLASLLASAEARGALRTVAEVAAVTAAGCWLHGSAGRRAACSGFATATDIVLALDSVVGTVSGVGSQLFKGDNWGMIPSRSSVGGTPDAR